MSFTSTSAQDVLIQVLSGPTVLIKYAGLRLLTDPTFDEPGEYPTPLPDFSLFKTAPSTVGPEELGRIDAVLLSHDEHDDNPDRSGRQLLSRVPVTLTTVSGAARLGGNARGLAFWDKTTLTAPDGTVETITGLPARHGPEGTEALSGDVVGFLLTTPACTSAGTTPAWTWSRRSPTATPPSTSPCCSSAGFATSRSSTVPSYDRQRPGRRGRKVLQARRVVPAHFEGWAHFRGTRENLAAAFDAAGVGDRLTFA